MKHPLSLVVSVLLLVFLCSCAATPPPPPPVPPYPLLRDGIRLRLKADHQLNQTDDVPHALLLCLYQLRDRSLFDQLAASEDGIYQLLDCQPFSDSVTAVKRLFIQPGQDLTFIMDRQAGTRSLGIVAGYAVLDKNRMIRVADVPVIVSEDGKSATAGELNLILDLGSQQIAAIEER